jgi:hypothetical protein
MYEMIKEPQWWVTVVIAGICINHVSGYLKNILDRRFSHIFNWWGYRSEKKRKEKESYIVRLAEDQQFLALNTVRLINSVKWTLTWFIIGALGFSITQTMDIDFLKLPTLFISSLALFRGYQHLLKSDQYYSYAEDAIDGDGKNT